MCLGVRTWTAASPATTSPTHPRTPPWRPWPAWEGHGGRVRDREERRGARDATQHELKGENGELKELVADLSLEAYRLKKTAIPMPQDATGTSG